MECASALEKKTLDPMICYLCPGTFQNVLDATNHLKSAHDKNNHGDSLQCMKRHRSGMFCNSKFNSIKALRKHLRDNACKLLSTDVDQDENNESSSFGWNQMDDIFGDLNFDEDKSSPEEEMHTLMEAHIKIFVDKLIVSTLPHDLVDEIVNNTKELVARITLLNKELIRNNASMDVGSALDSTQHFVFSQLNRFNTRYKRKLDCTESPHYVAPKTYSLNQDDTFQYVSILDTLHKLFANEKFKSVYFAYNNEHQCEEGVYERFCCGQNFKESVIFQSNRNNIQIQIFFDDVQLTSPLKTSPHKVCGIYFIIRNFPPEFVSKLDNMYLISLCDSKIVEKHGCNSILEPFIRDLIFLETNGLLVDGRLLKGTLVQVSFDNLGGNTIFGFTKGFNSTYYCRICICAIQQCRSNTVELVCKIRTKKHYEDQIMKIRQAQGVKLALSETFGIANYCVLNDLNFYHIIDNRSQDIMHDIYEGAMPFILHKFFERLIEHKIITAKEIEEKITSFDYGSLERKNKPSKLCLSKKNLNQNASQMHCLMRHIPFIFVYLLKLRDESKKRVVHNIWPVIEYMLKIDQIVSSTRITEKDLINLEKYSQEFLKIITNKLKANLIPKLHFITHYANTIRKMGPLVYLQMMRGDAKHQPFTQYAKRCRNYINICKTLSEKHQEVLTAKWSKNIYCDSINVSKKNSKIEIKTGVLMNELENHSALIYGHFKEAVSRVMLINSVTVNSFMFRKGLFIILSDEMHQIDAVLKCNDSFIFLCTKFTTSKFYEFANCFEIRKSNDVLLAELDMLVCRRTYEAKNINNQIQIMADNLDMIPIYEKNINISN